MPRSLYLRQEGYAFTLFVCLLAGLRNNYSAGVHNIWWKGDIWAVEEPVRFWW